MKKVTCTICLMLLLFISGCHGTPQVIHSCHTHSLFRLSFMTPGLYLVEKNIKELNAMMEAEEKAIAENVQRKNPIYFMEEKK